MSGASREHLRALWRDRLPMAALPMGRDDAMNPRSLPPRLAIDANGFCWRVYNAAWSMCPVNPDNSPVPEPVTYYAPETDLRERVAALIQMWDDSADSLGPEWNALGERIEGLRERVPSTELEEFAATLADHGNRLYREKDVARLIGRLEGLESVRRCNDPMPGGDGMQLCDRWPGHDGAHYTCEGLMWT